MKVTATILCLYLMALFLQPSLFPLQVKREKMMCCCKTNKGDKHKGCEKNSKEQDNCCDNCNPVIVNCSTCISLGVVSTPLVLSHNYFDNYDKMKFPRIEQHLTGSYQAKMLRPPDVVNDIQIV